MYIQRTLEPRILLLLQHFPAIAVLGPRQAGKTTLVKEIRKKLTGESLYLDLENPADSAALEHPVEFLNSVSGKTVIIDEIQRNPNLFSVLRVLVDKEPLRQRYLILGSASRDLIRQSSESLAGRIQYIELTPFSYIETKELRSLWTRGGYPQSFLAQTDQDSVIWRKNYVRTFLEQDIPALGIQIPPENLRRFWTMLAHYHGQIFNASEIGNSLNLSHHTVQKYCDILSGTFMVRQLSPWYENIGKRQVKSKKLYFRDSGIFHHFLNIADYNALLVSPKIGASWEGFALEAVIRHQGADPQECYFWSTQSHAELDLLIVQHDVRQGFEFKFSKTPTLTKSMHIAVQDLKLDKLTVIYPGQVPIRLTREIECMGLESYLSISVSCE
jgi:hypothetical protein